jgi:hypothetical protein
VSRRPAVPPRTISDFYIIFTNARVLLKNLAQQETLIPQFDIPIGNIKEVLPTLMRLGGEGDVYKGAPFRAFRFSSETHIRLVRETIPFTRIARNAGTNDIFPSGLPTAITRKDVIQVEHFAGKNTIAILAGVFIPLENIVTSELHLFFRKPLKNEKNNDSRDANLHGNGLGHLPVGMALRKIPPTFEIMSDESLARIRVHHLRVTLIEKRECPARAAGIYSLPEPVEN